MVLVRTRRLALALTAAALAVGVLVFFRPGQECQANPARASTRSNSASTPIPVSVLVVGPQEQVTSVPATGTLLPAESVTIVSELSRRLTRILAQEGTHVQKGAVLFELDKSDLVAERHRLEVQRKLAARNAERQAELLKESVTSEAEADAAKTAELEIRASQQMVAVTLDKATIRAPFDGFLGLRQVSEGAWVTPSTPLITLSDTSQLKIDFRIPERHAEQITLGAEFRIFVEGHASPSIGKITATEPSIDPNSRSLLVRGVVQSGGKLLPGTFAKVELPLVKKDAITIPPLAVIPGVGGRSVYVERKGEAHLVPVELGVRTPNRVRVERGLAPGDRVIVSNLLRLRDGARVTVEGDVAQDAETSAAPSDSTADQEAEQEP